MWLKELPQEAGDFLWVSMWGCDCCVHKSGIAWIHDVTEDDLPAIHYRVGERILGVSWEGTEPFFQDTEKKVPIIDGWLKLPGLPYRKENYFQA